MAKVNSSTGPWRPDSVKRRAVDSVFGLLAVCQYVSSFILDTSDKSCCGRVLEIRAPNSIAFSYLFLFDFTIESNIQIFWTERQTIHIITWKR
jgi:hypothetical protein